MKIGPQTMLPESKTRFPRTPQLTDLCFDPVWAGGRDGQLAQQARQQASCVNKDMRKVHLGSVVVVLNNI